MLAKAIVVGVLALAAAAIMDALRGVRAADPPPRTATSRDASRGLVGGRAHQFVAAGKRLHDHVLLDGREYLSEEAIRDAFPVRVGGPIAISRIAVAPDGTLVLALYRFPSATPAQSALQLWRDRRPIGGFGVPPGYFGGGLAFNNDGSLVATFSHDGRLRGIFDRSGRRIEGLPDSSGVLR